MKFTALALFTVIASSSIAQTLSQGEQYIQDAMVELRPSTNVFLRLRGYDTFGSKQTTLSTDVFWDQQNVGQPSEMARVELNEFKDTTQITRTVGNGIHLWSMDFTKNEYSASRYGNYGGAQPQGYYNDMLQTLATLAKGQNIYPVRLLREVYAGPQPVYRAWMPGATETVIDQPNQSVPDPIIPDRTYTATDTNIFILYSYKSSPQRSLCFELSRPTKNDPWNLSVIFLGDQSTYRGSKRLINLSVEVLPGTNTNGSFTFVPPKGARSVAAPKPSGG